MPCLYLPCFVIKDKPTVTDQYKLLIRLLQNNSIERVASCASLSPTPIPPMQGKQTYHSINNKMTEYSNTEEIGFDIDGVTNHSESEDEDAIDPWMIDIIGVKHTRVQQSKSEVMDSVEFLHSVHKKVVCSETSICENREEINYAIDKLLPRLRYECLASSIALLKQYNLITDEQGDPVRRVFRV